MAKLTLLLFTLGSLTVALTSTIPAEPKKNEGTTPSGVVMKTLMNKNMDDDQESMNDKDSTDLNWMEIINECNETFVIQPSYLQALDESGSFPDETDRNPKCYIRCVLEKTGVLSEEKFDPVRSAVVFAGERGGRPMTDVETMATTCGQSRVEPCKCERSYQFMKCLMEMEIQRYEKSAK